jgi:hypothetical protein
MVEEEKRPEDTVGGSIKLLNDPATQARLTEKSLRLWGSRSKWKNVFKKGYSVQQGKVPGTSVVQSRKLPYTITQFEQQMDDAIKKLEEALQEQKELLNESNETKRTASDARESGQVQEGVASKIRRAEGEDREAGGDAAASGGSGEGTSGQISSGGEMEDVKD